jgi:nucleotide-binding universal stress UspA family protein
VVAWGHHGLACGARQLHWRKDKQMERPTRFSTIIVALDGTRATENAVLGPARELARIYSSSLVLVRAAERGRLPAEDDPTSAPGVALAAGPPMDNVAGIDVPTIGDRPGDNFIPARAIENPEAAGYLNILDNMLEEEGFTVEFVDPDDDPADAIVQEARSRSAGLIIMGTRQRSGWERLFKGSTAEKVLRESPCPVLAVPLD